MYNTKHDFTVFGHTGVHTKHTPVTCDAIVMTSTHCDVFCSPITCNLREFKVGDGEQHDHRAEIQLKLGHLNPLAPLVPPNHTSNPL